MLGRELEDVLKRFADLTSKRLPAINSELKSKKLDVINVVEERDWQKSNVG